MSSNAHQATSDPTPQQQEMLDEAVQACTTAVNDDNPACSVRRVLPDGSVLVVDYHIEEGASFTVLEGEGVLSPREERYFDPDADNTLEDGTEILPPFDPAIFGGTA